VLSEAAASACRIAGIAYATVDKRAATRQYEELERFHSVVCSNQGAISRWWLEPRPVVRRVRPRQPGGCVCVMELLGSAGV